MSRRPIEVLLLLFLSGCARSDDAWRRQLTDPKSELFERGLAAIALAHQAETGLSGVPTHLLDVLDHAPESFAGPAREALISIGPAALPDMAQCVFHNVFYGELSRPALEAALVRHGPAAVGPLVEAMPAPLEAGSDRAAKIVAAIGEPAVAPLVEILRAGPAPRRARASFLLGSLGRSAGGAVDALLAVAAGDDVETAKIAVENLFPANPLGWKIEPVLRSVLGHANPEIRDVAVVGLARVLLERGARTAPGSRSKKRTDLLRDAASLGEAADGAYVRALTPPGSSRARFAADVLIARAVLWTLAPAPISRTLDEEAERVVHGSAVDRRLAAIAIGRRGRRALPALPVIVSAIGDPDEGLRFCASLSLALVAIDVGRAAALSGGAGNG